MGKVLLSLLIIAGSNSLLAFQNPGNSNSLENLYLTGSFGIINYDYTRELLNDNLHTTGISNTRTFAARFSVGFHLTNKWDLEFSVMRPRLWVQYNFESPNKFDKSVWTNIWAISTRRNFKFFGRSTLYLEGGVSNVSRKGFELNKEVGIPDARYIYPIASAGLLYPISKEIDAAVNLTISPPNKNHRQPATSFIATGIVYHVKDPSDNHRKSYLETPYQFPQHLFNIGIASDYAGFNTNKQFSSGLDTSIPIFWLGDVYVKNGISASYQKNLFHTRKNFSLSAGANIAYYNTQNDESFYAVSIFPVIKWWFLRTRPADVYFNYSIIGPAYITSSILDNLDTGEEFTFQDFMGIGLVFGKKRNYNLDFKITHYSNGNLFTDNPGVAIPLSINFGYAVY